MSNLFELPFQDGLRAGDIPHAQRGGKVVPQETTQSRATITHQASRLGITLGVTQPALAPATARENISRGFRPGGFPSGHLGRQPADFERVAVFCRNMTEPCQRGKHAGERCVTRRCRWSPDNDPSDTVHSVFDLDYTTLDGPRQAPPRRSAAAPRMAQGGSSGLHRVGSAENTEALSRRHVRFHIWEPHRRCRRFVVRRFGRAGQNPWRVSSGLARPGRNEERGTGE
jgi:hypothetical protein